VAVEHGQQHVEHVEVFAFWRRLLIVAVLDDIPERIAASKARRERTAAESVQAPKQTKTKPGPKSRKSAEEKRHAIGGNNPPANLTLVKGSAEIPVEQRKVENAINDLPAADKDSERCLREFKAACDAYLPGMNADDLKEAQRYVAGDANTSTAA